MGPAPDWRDEMSPQGLQSDVDRAEAERLRWIVRQFVSSPLDLHVQSPADADAFVSGFVRGARIGVLGDLAHLCEEFGYPGPSNVVTIYRIAKAVVRRSSYDLCDLPSSEGRVVLAAYLHLVAASMLRTEVSEGCPRASERPLFEASRSRELFLHVRSHPSMWIACARPEVVRALTAGFALGADLPILEAVKDRLDADGIGDPTELDVVRLVRRRVHDVGRDGLELLQALREDDRVALFYEYLDLVLSVLPEGSSDRDGPQSRAV